jgi:P-type E1-E2 ATPase
MFVGDGLNDAPAMAASDVSISMKSEGNELTSENADIILLRNNLLCLPYLKELSASTNKIIMQNIICGVLFVVVGIFLASSGILNPAFAAIFHLLDAVFIVFNSARLIKVNM